MPSMSRTERAALCNTALEAGEDAPTLCGDWTVRDLVTHLLVRERDPLGAPGLVVPALEGLTRRAMRRTAREDFTALVERLRGGPPRWSPMWIPAADKALNTLEFFIHHEDIRRAAPAWTPRELTEREQRALWRTVSVAGKGLVRPAGVPVMLRWSAGPGAQGQTETLVAGPDPVVVSGAPSEIAMFCFNRAQSHGLDLSGPPDAVSALQRGRVEP